MAGFDAVVFEEEQNNPSISGLLRKGRDQDASHLAVREPGGWRIPIRRKWEARGYGCPNGLAGMNLFVLPISQTISAISTVEVDSGPDGFKNLRALPLRDRKDQFFDPNFLSRLPRVRENLQRQSPGENPVCYGTTIFAKSCLKRALTR